MTVTVACIRALIYRCPLFPVYGSLVSFLFIHFLFLQASALWFQRPRSINFYSIPFSGSFTFFYAHPISTFSIANIQVMQVKVQHRSPAVRARRGKRQISDPLPGDPNTLGPITLTVTEVRQPPSSQVIVPTPTPTVTVFVPPSTSGFTTSSIPLSTSVFTTSPGTSSTIGGIPIPSASASNNGVVTNNGSKGDKGDKGSKNDTAQSKAPSSTGIPLGSIIGIVLAIVLILVAAIIFLIRKRSVRNRLRLRGWANKGASAPSFLWIEPRDAKGATPYPNMASSGPNRGEPQGVSFPRPPAELAYAPPVGNGLPYIPPPAPPRPPPAHGTQNPYDYSPSPPAGIPAALSAGISAGRVPVPASPASSFIPPPPPESAKVRSTFIPTLPDELSISTGEVIRIQAAYDDGWALCSNARGEMGMVPLECLDRGSASQEEAREYKKLARVSSLAAAKPYGGYY